MLNGFAFAVLLTSLFVLRFRGWKRPRFVVAYFVFFAALEMLASHFFLPPGAIGPELAWVCFGLTLPVSIATYLVWRYEKAEQVED
jgi:succinate-acetate transporter protein